jgi:hypothetical protein
MHFLVAAALDLHFRWGWQIGRRHGVNKKKQFLYYLHKNKTGQQNRAAKQGSKTGQQNRAAKQAAQKLPFFVYI